MRVLRIKSTSRRYRCEVPGCGTLTHNLVAKRDDVMMKPMHICDDCINGLYAILHPAEDAPAEAEPVSLEVAEPEAEPIEVHSASEYRRLDAMGVLDEISTPEKPVRRRKAKTE